MRRRIGPYLTAGLILAAATTMAISPVLAPYNDIRVSSTDLASGHDDLDLLNRAFFEPAEVFASGPSTSDASLEDLLTKLVGAKSETDSVLLTDAVASDPVLALSVLAVTPISTPSTGLKTTSSETTAGLLRALAVIGSGFGEAGTAFIEQVGTAPAAITEMAAQVEAGLLEPDDAIRRLAAASLNAVISGPAKAIGSSIIHEVFEENSLIPILDAATNAPVPSNTDPRYGARATDAIDQSIAPGLTGATEVAEDPAAVVDSTQEAADNEVVSGNTVVQVKPEPPRNRAFRPGQILNRMSERINQRLKDLQERLAGDRQGTQSGDNGPDAENESAGGSSTGESAGGP